MSYLKFHRHEKIELEVLNNDGQKRTVKIEV